jgi:outer membrane protein assembly factor BamB
MLKVLTTILVVGIASCKSIPLNDDPTVPRAQANVTKEAIYEIAWTNPLVKTGLLEWKPIEAAAPCVDPDSERIITLTRDGFVRSLSPIDGKIEWSFETKGKFFGGATVVDGVVYVSGGDGNLYALESMSGAVKWNYEAKEELVTVPVVRDGKIFIASQGETVFAVDASNGKWIWQYRRDQPNGFSIRGIATPLIVEDEVLMGFADGFAVALGVEDGVLRWEQKLTKSAGTQFLDVNASLVADESGNVYAASYKDGIFALDAKTGEIKWKSARPGINSMLLSGSTLFLSGDGSVTAMDTTKGNSMWSVNISDHNSKGPTNNAGRDAIFARGFLVVPTSTALAFIEPSTGMVRAAVNPGRGVSATPGKFNSIRFGSRLYVLSNLGTLIALDMVSTGG